MTLNDASYGNGYEYGFKPCKEYVLASIRMRRITFLTVSES